MWKFMPSDYHHGQHGAQYYPQLQVSRASVDNGQLQRKVVNDWSDATPDVSLQSVDISTSFSSRSNFHFHFGGGFSSMQPDLNLNLGLQNPSGDDIGVYKPQVHEDILHISQ
ncbi:hypothetical protein S245_036952, partial [Arachis hypogaea]